MKFLRLDYTKVVDPKKEQAADAIKLDLKSDVI